MKAKNPLVAIFAHPDDESFGPSGSLALFARERDVYVICVTGGEAGTSSTVAKERLAGTRHEELMKASAALGVKKVFCLGFKDGCLCNGIYHEVAAKIQKILEDLKPDTILTFGENGVSGHIDHIAISYISTFVFQKLKFIREIYYYVLTREQQALVSKDYFIYYPPGYQKSQIDKTISIEPVWEQKIKAMSCHESQYHDYRRNLKKYETLPKEEYFIITTK